ncbi:hypothetical protein GF360_00255 [candidate division WWE3 bacterium]|nr:hypothetical protein [candidate division WWE3 bacterium]
MYIFPTLYILSCLIIFLRPRQNKKILWIPTTTIFFLVMTMKEFSELGFIYAFLDKYLPLFGVVFRFGDTKLHTYIAFAGALAIGIAAGQIIKKTENKKILQGGVTLGTTLILVATGIVFREYFTGNLVGFFIYNRIPQAYYEIAETVQETSKEGRVVHLPYDEKVYWRSYEWGYIGSHFFGYILENPLIEKTFEPASMENAYLNEEVLEITKNSRNLASQEGINRRAQKLYKLLKMAGVSHIIHDETVKTASLPRGLLFWANFNHKDIEILLHALEKSELIEKQETANIDLRDYIYDYEKLFTVEEKLLQEYKMGPIRHLTLYKVKEPERKFEFVKEIVNIKPGKNLLYALENLTENFREAPTETGYIYFPFKTPTNTMNKEETGINLKVGETGPNGNNSIETMESSTQHLLNLEVKKENEQIFIRINEFTLPQLDNKKFLKNVAEFSYTPAEEKQDFTTDTPRYLADWHVLPYQNFAETRLRIEETVIPLPKNQNTNYTEIANILVHTNDPIIEILEPEIAVEINPAEIALTENPNCVGDMLDKYEVERTWNNESVRVNVTNGSACLWRGIQTEIDKTPYAEISLATRASTQDLEKNFKPNPTDTSKPQLRNVITSLEKPTILEICLKEASTDRCLNKHRLLKLTQEESTATVPISSNTSNSQNILALFTLKNMGYQKMKLQISDVRLHKFAKTNEFEVNLANPGLKIENIQTAEAIEIPKILSNNSFYYNPEIEGLYASNGACSYKRNGYNTNRLLSNIWVGYTENCKNDTFQTVPYLDEGFYLWNYEYNLASGKFPEFKVSGPSITLINNWTSLNQGYPDITGFKAFQDPEYFFNNSGYEDVKTRLENLSFQQTYEYIYPQPGMENNQPKNYSIEQFAENEGLILIKSFEIVELPKHWEHLALKGQDYKEAFDTPANYSYRKILPSLWKIEIEKAQTDKNYLLKFNEGFDKQWTMFVKGTNILPKRIEKAGHTRCNGLVNCFEIDVRDVTSKEKTIKLWVFYWPDVFYWMGIAISLGTLVAGAIYLKQKQSPVLADDKPTN